MNQTPFRIKRPVRTKESWFDLAKIDGPAGRDDCQFGWQQWIGTFFNNRTILDVGAGLGFSRDRLAAGGNELVLQDPAPGTPVDIHQDVAHLVRRHFDIVTAFDVIEHVAEDSAFLWQLCSIARHAVVITTPNFDVSKAANPFHVREYSPKEFLDLIAGLPVSLLVAGNSNGTERVILGQDEFAKHSFPHQAVILDVSTLECDCT
jgi:2-polyprenyl-3-methyl-5-hydroxy-6-metoxy-1,4-benzoquinol methylase